MPAEPSPRVTIIGAGIGGLTAALACRAAKLEVDIYEQATVLAEAGAGIQLSPNATRILRAFGLLEQVYARSFVPRAARFRAARSGYVIAHMPLGSLGEARYGAPYLHIHRDDLHQVLRQAAEDAGARLHLGKRFQSFRREGASVQTQFEDGSDAWCELLIGADGIKSRVQAALFGEQSPRFTGHMVWRGLVQADDVPENLIEPAVTAWLGPARHFVHYYVRGGQEINFVGVVETERWTEESWSIDGDPEEMRRDFQDWHPDVQQLISRSTSCFKWALYDRPPLERWSVGRVTLLGDACHPMRPFLAQGAAMAIEDAWVLGRFLDTYETEVEQALTEYEYYRRPRTAIVQRRSIEQGRMYHERSRSAQLMRNFKLAAGTRLVPDIAMQQYDWLFGYDAIKGFD